jgi:lipoprotein-releasing system permease protein
MIERFIAARYLKAGKGAGFARVVTWFSFIGIALGVATLIIVTSVMNGFRIELLEKIVGMKGHVVVSSSNSDRMPSSGIAEKINKSSSKIVRSVPQIERQAVLLSDRAARGVIVRGISKTDVMSNSLIASNIKSGSLEALDRGEVAIGIRMSESIGVYQGDYIKLFIPNAIITPFGKVPKEESFKVGCIFEVGMNEYDKNIVIVPLKAAQSFFDLEEKITQVEVFVDNINNSGKVTEQISRSLGNGFLVLDWKHSDSSIFHAVVVEKNVMTLILSIIILVAMFSIVSGLTMLTSSKTRDIAILRTLGITQSSIMKIFFYMGASIGIFGTVTGISLGLLVSLNIERIKRFLESLSGSSLFNEEIYFLSQIPSKIDWYEVTYTAVFTLILSFIAALYPARRASKLDPAEALRI